MSKATTSPKGILPLMTAVALTTSTTLKPCFIVPSCFPVNVNISLAYEIDWSPDQVQWIIDGAVVRTLTAASTGGQYPQTPCQVRIGTWCGGCPGNAPGTIQWAGGPTTFSPGDAFAMTITSLTIQNANPAGSYIYGDMSGDAASIQMGGPVPLPAGNSTNGSASASGSASQSGSASASSSASSSQSSASSAATSSQEASPTKPPSKPSGATTKPAAATTGLIGPTATTLPSSASKLALSGIAALILGAIVFLA
jgi:beta-glucanase (GH16 family)